VRELLPLRDLPLREGGADAFERSLLEAGCREAPSAAVRARMRAAVGVGSALAVWSAAAEGVAGTEAMQAPAAVSHGLWGLPLTKWVGISIVAGVVAAGGIYVLRSPSRTAPEPTQRVPALQAKEPLPAQPAPPVQAPEPQPAETAAQQPATVARSVADSAVARRVEQGGISRELELLEKARVALASGDTARSAALLAEHRRFPKRALGPEAQILGIQVALAQGRRAEAARRAEAFLQAQPRSPHARRVRSLLQAARGERTEQARSNDLVDSAEQER
jgi:hypothetical protein